MLDVHLFSYDFHNFNEDYTMYSKLRDLIASDSPLDQFESDREVQIAAITLLVEAGLSNSAYAGFELGRAVDFTKSEFCLTDAEAGDLLEIVRILRTNPKRSDTIIELLKEKLNTDQLIQLLSVVWKVLLADGKIDSLESEYAVNLRKSLGLTMEQAVLAQQLAVDMNATKTSQ